MEFSSFGIETEARNLRGDLGRTIWGNLGENLGGARPEMFVRHARDITALVNHRGIVECKQDSAIPMFTTKRRI
jgi:hypothetical protein